MIKISAVTSVYNQKDTIEQTIKSVLAITEHLEEYIILNDGSNDGTEKIVEKYAQKNPIIKLLVNKKNMGTVYSFRRIFAESKGNYVLGIAGDDYLEPKEMEKLINFAQCNPNQSMYFCNLFIEYVDNNSKRINIDFKIANKGTCFTPENIGKAINGKTIASAGMLIKKEHIIDSTLYRDDFKWQADWIANLIIAFRYGGAYLPVSTVTWRVQSTAFSAQRNDWKKQKALLKYIIQVLKQEEYKDVYINICRYNLFKRLGFDSARLLIVTPSLWDRFTLKVIYASVSRGLYEHLSALLPQNFKNKLKGVFKIS